MLAAARAVQRPFTLSRYGRYCIRGQLAVHWPRQRAAARQAAATRALRARQTPTRAPPAPSRIPRRSSRRPTVRAMASAAGDWLKEDKRRLLHAVYRVGDMQARAAAQR